MAKLSNDEKRQLVRRFLATKESRGMTARQVAERLGVSQPFVSKLRKEGKK
jgi:transcriptional regulator with XRE-family HTH domain